MTTGPILKQIVGDLPTLQALFNIGDLASPLALFNIGDLTLSLYEGELATGLLPNKITDLSSLSNSGEAGSPKLNRATLQARFPCTAAGRHPACHSVGQALCVGISCHKSPAEAFCQAKPKKKTRASTQIRSLPAGLLRSCPCPPLNGQGNSVPFHNDTITCSETSRRYPCADQGRSFLAPSPQAQTPLAGC